VWELCPACGDAGAHGSTRTPKPTTCLTKKANASPIKEFKTIQKANPKMTNLEQPKNSKPNNMSCLGFPNQRVPNRTTSQSNNAKTCTIQETQTQQKPIQKCQGFPNQRIPKNSTSQYKNAKPYPIQEPSKIKNY
jgi:hypothetical protein